MTKKEAHDWQCKYGAATWGAGWNTMACNGSIYAVTANVDIGSTSQTVVYSYPETITYPAVQSSSWQAQTLAQTDNWLNSLSGMYDYLTGLQYRTSGYDPRTATLYWQQPEESAAEVAKLKERVAQREAAEQRAQKLLFTILTPTQVKQYTDDDYFEVPVGERLYRLRKGRSMNVELMEAGKPKIKFCAHPTDAYDLPVPDVMLSQLLALRSNEAEFLRIANKTVLQ